MRDDVSLRSANIYEHLLRRMISGWHERKKDVEKNPASAVWWEAWFDREISEAEKELR